MSYQGVQVSSNFDLTSGSINRTVNVPSGAQIGDTLIAVVFAHNTNNGASPTMTADFGVWNQYGAFQAGNIPSVSDHAFIRVLTKKILATPGTDPGDPTSYTFTVTRNGQNMFGAKIALFLYRNIDLATTSGTWQPDYDSSTTFPNDGPPNFLYSGNVDVTKLADTNVVGEELTTSITLWMLVTFSSAASVVFNGPASNTVQATVDNATNNRNLLHLCDEPWASASSYPSRTASWDVSGTNSGTSSTLVIRLRPNGPDTGNVLPPCPDEPTVAAVTTPYE